MTRIRYIERTRDYYRALGFERDYAWASNGDIPFTRPPRPLEDCTATIVTTAVVEHEIPKPIRVASSYPFSSVPAAFDTSELSWDKETTHTDDRASYFPFEYLQAFVAERRLGRLADRFHFVPTEYSQRHTLDNDAPAILDACLRDEVDVAFLVPI